MISEKLIELTKRGFTQMTYISTLFATVVFTALIAIPMTSNANEQVNITKEMSNYEFTWQEKKHVIARNQDTEATVNPVFAKTSRPCPWFCIQPATLAPGVDTIAELEVINYIKRMVEGENILVVDSRTPDWVARGTIATAKNIPWTKLYPSKSSPETISSIMQKEFGAKLTDGLWDFSNAKTLVMFCNGMWCAQSPNNIKALLTYGYPAQKLKWYRGGMQDWEILGLSTVKLK
jgi:rhodanese-related sulfurtransferase